MDANAGPVGFESGEVDGSRLMGFFVVDEGGSFNDVVILKLLSTAPVSTLIALMALIVSNSNVSRASSSNLGTTSTKVMSFSWPSVVCKLRRLSLCPNRGSRSGQSRHRTFPENSVNRIEEPNSSTKVLCVSRLASSRKRW